MKERFDLQDIAINVNQILDAYISIENQSFKASWRRIIPLPFLFEAVDFGELSEQAKTVKTKLTEEYDTLHTLCNTFPEDSPEEQFANLFSSYCGALISAVDMLQCILKKLFQKSQHAEQYSLAEYRADCKEYGELRESYLALGNQANNLYSAAFNS